MRQRAQAIRERLEKEGADAFLCSYLPNCHYLSGFTGSNCLIIVDKEENLFFTDFRYREQFSQEVEGYQYREVKNSLNEGALSYLEEKRLTRVAFEAMHLPYDAYSFLMDKGEGKLTLMPMKGWVEELRAVKEPHEVALIKRACNIVDAAFRGIYPILKVGQREREVATAIHHLLLEKGAHKAAFDIIVASGRRASLPHGTFTLRKVKGGEVVLMDFGAQYRGYHSDLTRTVFLDTIKVDKRLLSLYPIVLRAQREAIKAARPGMEAKALDAVARHIIEEAGYGAYFGHGLGHGVGLEVHEEPRISPFGNTTLKEGMVFTIEPGIYLPEIGGIRIEDVVHLRDRGCQLLTHAHRELLVL